MRLIEALRYRAPTSIAFVGAGGKTTALFQAAREIISAHNPADAIQTALVTTSTHLGAWQATLADHSYQVSSLEELQAVFSDLPDGVVLITGVEKDQLLGGLSAVLMDEIQHVAELRELPLLIEADGAHTKPLKAPAAHEPAIPEFVQQVVVVAGLGGLGKPLTNEWVQRVDEFATLSGLNRGDIVTGEALIKVLGDKRGGLKRIPCGARKRLLLNQADTPELQSQAKVVGEALLSAYDGIIIASLDGNPGERRAQAGQNSVTSSGIIAVVEAVGGIILAAGGSSRFGEPKQLLPWKGEPLVRHVARAALQAGLAPVVVVAGASAEAMETALTDLSLRIVINQEWSKGLSTSIKTGLEALPADLGGVVFLQGDQPQIPATLVQSLIEAHQASLNPITAPLIDGQRGNPVLFDVCTLAQLSTLEGDMGGRALFSRYPVDWVPWHDRNLLIDIDTPEDYERFLRIYPSGEEHL